MDNEHYISRGNLLIFNNNEPLNNYIDILNKYKIIYFGNIFNQELSNIPENIETIIFSEDSIFNQEIKNLHSNLKKIHFGNNFIKSLDYLPDSLEEIIFNSESLFDSDLSNLPKSIKKIILGYKYSKSLNYLPSGLEYLKLCGLYNQEIKVFPNNLKYLEFYYYNCNRYRYGGEYIPPYEKLQAGFYNYKLENLPENLIEIKYPTHYEFQIKKIPKSLEVIRINYNYKYINDLKKDFSNINIYTN